MLRQTFLDTQLWLRRVDESEFRWNESAGDVQIRRRRQLLPPTASVNPVSSRPASQSQSHSQSASQSEAPNTMSSCSGCFHNEKSMCYFHTTDANEDQTVVRIELVATEQTSGDCGLFVRLDGDQVYEVALSAIRAVVLPKEEESSDSAKPLPPFGSLDFGSVSLRLWMEPHDAPTTGMHLAKALHQVEMLRSQFLIYSSRLKTNSTTHSTFSWRSCYRHNPWLVPQTAHDEAVTRMAPSQIVERGKSALTSAADKEALRTVLDTIVRRRSRLAARNRSEASLPHVSAAEQNAGPSQSQPQAEPSLQDHGDHDLSRAEYFELVTSLVHLLGEDHAGLRVLLGVEPKENDNAPKTPCVAAKWRKWDDFLQLAEKAFPNPHKRPRTSRDSANESTTVSATMIQDASSAFEGAIFRVQQEKDFGEALSSAGAQLRQLEDDAFHTLFPKSARSQASHQDNVQQGQPSQKPAAANTSVSTPTQTPPTLDPGKVEHMWNFLLESRRALVRQELTTICLPQRAHGAKMGTE